MSIVSEVNNTNNFLENSRMIHIAAEVLVVSGLTSYVVYQNKKLTASVQELTARLEEKEEMYAKLEGAIQQFNVVISQLNQKVLQHENGLNILSDRISSISEASAETYKRGKSVVKSASGAKGKQVVENTKKDSKESRDSKDSRDSRDSKESRHVKPLFKETPPVSRVSKIQFKKPLVESDSDDDKNVSKSSKSIEELSDSDLDDEISQELAELEEVDSEDSSLKKEQ